MNKNELFLKVKTEIKNTLASLTFIRHAAAYKTRQHIKLSDAEIKDLENEISLSLAKTMLTACVASKIIQDHSLEAEFAELIAEVTNGVAGELAKIGS